MNTKTPQVHISNTKQRMPKGLANSALSMNRHVLGYSDPYAMGEALVRQVVRDAEWDAQQGKVRHIFSADPRGGFEQNKKMNYFDRAMAKVVFVWEGKQEGPLRAASAELKTAKAIARAYRKFSRTAPEYRAGNARRWGTSVADLERLVRVYFARWKRASAIQ
jgi:hypothetical protein